MSLEELLDGYNAFLEHVVGIQTCRRRRRLRQIEDFVRFLRRRGIHCLSQVPVQMWDRWIARRVRGRGEQVRRNLGQAVRGLLRYVHLRGVACAARPEHFPPTRRHRLDRVPRTIDERLLKRFFAAIDRDTPVGLRDDAIFTTLLTTGLRPSELLKARLSDLRWDPPRLYVAAGKTGRDRVVPLPAAAEEALRRYLKRARPPEAGDALWVAISRVRLPAARKKLTARPILTLSPLQDAVRRYRKAAGLGRRITAYMFRHTFASHLIEQGAGFQTVKELLGHASLASTMIYTKVPTRALMEVADTYADEL